MANADQILVFEKGRIIERGTFKQLVAMEGLFARLVHEGGFTVPEPDAELEPVLVEQVDS